MRVINAHPGLMHKTLEELDTETLNPLSPEVISRQATINIGTIGHVAHGKSTLVKAITNINTVKTSKEKFRNITIKLGYANAKIYKRPGAPAPDCYLNAGSGAVDNLKCPKSGEECTLFRHISFVDCPGHDLLMATMLAGASVMDAAVLLIAANEPCPQPQTSEHLAAVQVMKLKHIIIVQNKVDTIVNKEGHAAGQHADIREFIKGTKAERSPIVPVSAQLKYNIDVVLDYICRIPIPVRNFTAPPLMTILRSFDINKPGTEIEKLSGGVVGGSLLQGLLRVGEKIEIRPGIIGKDKRTGEQMSDPIISRITTLRTEENSLLYAVPGGLIAVGLQVDPTCTRADKLNGQVLGHPG